MRAYLPILLAGCCLGSSGCQLVTNAGRNVAFQLALRSDEFSACLRDRACADDAWIDVQRANPGQAFSEHYVRGFKAGFLDAFHTCGASTPVPIPPQVYWKRYFQTAEGQLNIEAWFAGFRHGAAVGKDSPFCPRPSGWGAAALQTVAHAPPPAVPPPGMPPPGMPPPVAHPAGPPVEEFPAPTKRLPADQPAPAPPAGPVQASHVQASHVQAAGATGTAPGTVPPAEAR
jgi:hypothetical protein